MCVSRLAVRLARALRFTPSQDQVASALLGVPPAQARAEVYREAAAALAATATRYDVATRAEFATNEKRLRESVPSRRLERAWETTKTNDAVGDAVLPSPPAAAVRASSIPGAGAGLFVTRHIPRGKLVALYGGVYVPPVPPVTPGADGTAVIIPAPAPADDDGDDAAPPTVAIAFSQPPEDQAPTDDDWDRRESLHTELSGVLAKVEAEI